MSDRMEDTTLGRELVAVFRRYGIEDSIISGYIDDTEVELKVVVRDQDGEAMIRGNDLITHTVTIPMDAAPGFRPPAAITPDPTSSRVDIGTGWIHGYSQWLACCDRCDWVATASDSAAAAAAIETHSRTHEGDKR